MGLPMAYNLLKAGYALHVWNRTPAKAEGLLVQGATWAPSPQVLATRTGLVLSMVADDDALNAVALGADGILAGLPHEGIHVDMSTVLPDTTQGLARVYRERGAYFVAAPVSGRPDHAITAQLLIYPAGPAAALVRCQPLWQTLGQGVLVVGNEPHLASLLKLVINFVVSAINETLSEAFTWAEKAGLSYAPLLEILEGFFPALIIQLYARRIAHLDFYSPGASVRLGLKDVGHMRKLADQVAAPLPLADLVYRHLQAALARGRGDLDQVALVSVVRELAGLAPGLRERSEGHNDQQSGPMGEQMKLTS
jgi:3-hydroxyisobutyrate dehydrogenase-like beta-hydroxyacid dehydrogenase